jgi:hypothetical protein
VVFSILRLKRAGRRWWERWPSKSTQTEVNIVDVANLVKNDPQIASRMIAESLNIPKTVVLQILKEDLRKRKLCARFVSHSSITEQREDLSHILLRHYRDGRCRQKFFLTKLLWEMKPGVLSTTLKQSKRVLNGLVRHPFSRRNWNSTGPASRPCWSFFFNSQGVVHKEFVPEGKTVNAEFYKGVMDHHLKHIQLVCPATFCSWDFFLVAQ